MNIAINLLSVLMGVFGFILVFGGIFNKHFELIICGIVYLLGAGIAFRTESFIPLVIAFVIAFILRKIGLDPSFGNSNIKDSELIEKAWPKDVKKEYTLEEVQKGIRDLGKNKQ